MSVFFGWRAVLVAVCLGWGAYALAEAPTPPPSAIYEIVINGENFLVEGDRATKLESKTKPGVSYDVAIRMAQSQRLRLNTLQMDYDLPAKVQRDENDGSGWAQIVHELGFTILLNDLGQPRDEKKEGKNDTEEAFNLLVKSVKETLEGEAKEKKLEVGEPYTHQFAHSSARGVTIRYHDSRDFEHVCLIYILTAPRFRATCVVEYLSVDADDVLPLIQKALDSVRAVGKDG